MAQKMQEEFQQLSGEIECSVCALAALLQKSSLLEFYSRDNKAVLPTAAVHSPTEQDRGCHKPKICQNLHSATETPLGIEKNSLTHIFIGAVLDKGII